MLVFSQATRISDSVVVIVFSFHVENLETVCSRERRQKNADVWRHSSQ